LIIDDWSPASLRTTPGAPEAGAEEKRKKLNTKVAKEAKEEIAD
jgi:hypothetical protein